jgi:hypothetical protein
MPKTLTVAEARAALSSFETIPQLRAVLRALPRELDPRIAARAVLPMLDDEYGSASLLARTAVPLEPRVIRAVLQLLEKRSKNVPRVFLREAVDVAAPDAQLQRAWGNAIKALRLFESSGAWGDRQTTLQLRRVAADQALVRGAGAAAIATRSPRRHLLAVLAIDGSEASIDALIAHASRKSLKREFDSLRKIASPRVASALGK